MKKLFFFVVLTVTLFQGIEYSQPSTNHQSQITIKDAWVRPAVKGANSALYFIIQNNGNKPDTLIDAKSIMADIVEVHETYKMSNDRMGMRQIEFIAVPSKSKLEFKPGRYHVMLLDVQKDFKIGDLFDAVLIFKHAGKIKVKALVRDMPGNVK